jgi:hypothetical protein
VLANPYGETIESCDGLGNFIEDTDKAFEITITVEPTWYGDTEVALAAYNSQGVSTQSTHTENWFFNPAISIDVSTTNGDTITFGPMDPVTRFAHSVNKIKIKNTAEGGVNLWMYIAGTDLYDPSGASKCPYSNYIDIEENMYYRGWTGTQWSDGDGWKPMKRYNQDAVCNITTCYGGVPVPEPWPYGNLLTNQGTLEIEFKLHYPLPCIGTFSHGTIYIFGKAV